MTRRLLASTCLLLASAAVTGLGAEVFPYDHMHFNVTDPAKAVAWYQANLGAKLGASPDRVVIGRTIFAFTKTEQAASSAGSAIDHLGFSVADVDATVKALQAAGATVLTPARDTAGLGREAVVEDPFGVRLKILRDADSLGFHHIHLRVPDPDASLKWYVDNFGGERTKWKGQVDAVKYTVPTVWLMAEQSADATPSQGRSIDHISWAVGNVDAKVGELASKGLKTVEPRAVRTLRVGFVEGPGGVRIEMVQGRTEEELIGR